MRRYALFLLFAALWAAAFCGVLFVGGYTYWFTAGCLGVLLVYAWISYAVAWRGITVSVKLFHTYLTAGDSAEVEIRLERTGLLLPLAWLAVNDVWKDNAGADAYRCSRLFYPGFTRVFVYRYAIGSIERGRYGGHRVELSTGDAFGLLRRSRTWLTMPQTELIVVPRPLPLSGFNLGRQGQLQRQATSGSFPAVREQVASVRDYRPGDPLRQIHWKASAHSGEWKSVETEAESSACLTVFVDRAVGMGGRTGARSDGKVASWSSQELGLFEAVLQTACGQLTAGAKLGLRLRLAVSGGGDRRHRETGPHGLRELLVELAGLNPDPADSASATQLLRSSAFRRVDGVLLVVTAAPEEPLLAACGQLARAGQAVEVCHVAAAETEHGQGQEQAGSPEPEKPVNSKAGKAAARQKAAKRRGTFDGHSRSLAEQAAAKDWASRFTASGCAYRVVYVPQPAAKEDKRHETSA